MKLRASGEIPEVISYGRGRVAGDDGDSVSDDCRLSEAGQSSVISDIASSIGDAGEEVPPPDALAELGLDADSPDDVADVRAKPGTYVLQDMSDCYFTFSDHPAFDDVKVAVKPRWLNAADMGTNPKTKAVTPRHYGEVKGVACQRSWWVLKAWCIYRFKANGFEKKRIQAKWLVDQVAQLKAEIGPSTGNVEADAFIHSWAPEVL